MCKCLEQPLGISVLALGTTSMRNVSNDIMGKRQYGGGERNGIFHDGFQNRINAYVACKYFAKYVNIVLYNEAAYSLKSFANLKICVALLH